MSKEFNKEELLAKATAERLKWLSENKTLGEYLSNHFDCFNDEEHIREVLDLEDGYIEAWANDNDLTCDEVIEKIISLLNSEIEFEVIANTDDSEPYKTGPNKKPTWCKEVWYNTKVCVDNLVLDFDESYEDFEIL